MRKRFGIIDGFFIGIIIGLLWAVFQLSTPPSTVQAQAGSGHKAKYISSATTTALGDGNGYLETVTINGGATGVVTLYDVAASGCTGTPGSGKFATIQAATAPVTLFYQLRVFNGLCVVTAAATDVTVTFD